MAEFGNSETHDQKRRTFLTMAGTAGLVNLAGCAGDETDDGEDNQLNESREEGDSTEERDEEDKTEAPPSVSELNVAHEGGDLLVSGRITASAELDAIQIVTAGESVTLTGADVIDESAEESYFEATISVERGDFYTPRVQVTDSDDNSIEKHGSETYVPLSERPILSPYYTWYDSDRWDQGHATEPVLGRYSSDDQDVIDQHLEWIEQAGINTLVVSWWGPSAERYETALFETGLLDSPWPSDLSFCVLYEPRGDGGGRLNVIDGALDMNDQENRETLTDDLKYFSEHYFQLDEYFTMNGRPVVYFWIAGALAGDVSEAFNEAISHIPEEPYLIADLNLWDQSQLAGTAIAEVFDGITDYIMFAPEAYRDGNTPRVDEYLTELNQTLDRWQVAAEKANLDFYPVVQPGFTEFGDQENSVHERDPEVFRQACEAVRERVQPGHEAVVVTSFNEWHEDTQVEPDATAGTAYLDIVREELVETAPTLDASTVTPVVFDFSKTASPSERIGTDDTRELAFACSKLQLIGDDGVEAEYNIGGDEEPMVIDGAFSKEDDGGRTFRWFGGPAAQSVLGTTVAAADVQTVAFEGRAFIDVETTVTIGTQSAEVTLTGGWETYDIELS